MGDNRKNLASLISSLCWEGRNILIKKNSDLHKKKNRKTQNQHTTTQNLGHNTSNQSRKDSIDNYNSHGNYINIHRQGSQSHWSQGGDCFLQ